MTDWYDPDNFPIPINKDVIIKGRVIDYIEELNSPEVVLEASVWRYPDGKEPKQNKENKEDDV
jgi:hypothetical protein